MMRRRLTIALLFLLLFACATVAWARVGGGESYSGGSSGSGGGGNGGGEALFLLLRLLFWMNIEHPLIGIPVDILLVIIWIRVKRRGIGSGSLLLVRASTADLAASTASTVHSDPFAVLRRFDPNFSEIVFGDFCYSLYGRVHNARGANDLDRYAPYVGEAARRSLIARNPPGLTEVRGIVVGSFKVVGVRFDGKTVLVTVDYESNMTEISTGEASWYLRERWTFERERDILSPPPEKAKAEHCPRCGAALKTRTDGSCEYCGVKITSGAFQWFVRNITVTAKESRGPLLTSNVPEQGTSLPTKLQPNFREQLAQFQSAHPEFRWEDLEHRARETAKTLQDAWTARDWERVRPLESDTLFQTASLLDGRLHPPGSAQRRRRVQHRPGRAGADRVRSVLRRDHDAAVGEWPRLHDECEGQSRGRLDRSSALVERVLDVHPHARDAVRSVEDRLLPELRRGGRGRHVGHLPLLRRQAHQR